jgi:hypothetical protein
MGTASVHQHGQLCQTGGCVLSLWLGVELRRHASNNPPPPSAKLLPPKMATSYAAASKRHFNTNVHMHVQPRVLLQTCTVPVVFSDV